MSCKFNSGRGCHICDRCRVMLCDGTLENPKRLSYHYSSCKGPEQHYLVRKQTDTSSWHNEDELTDNREENPWKHKSEFCPECAAIMLIQYNTQFTTAKELYNL